MSSNEPARRILVVGAGLAGLVCARVLRALGHAVVVLDKGRAPGGRSCTRTSSDGARFDHGAQYFTARSAWLRQQLQRWQELGVVAAWAPRLAPGMPARGRDDTWWVGTPGMGSLAAHLARGLELRLGETVRSVSHDGTAWQVHANVRYDADVLVLAVPAPQCAALLGADSSFAPAIAAVRLEPCWAAMARIESDGPAPFDLVMRREGALAWAAREGSKPGRARVVGQERWVVHAAAAWSREHLEDDPRDVARVLAEQLQNAIGAPVADAVAHRWRYARATVRDSGGCLIDARTALAICGDWTEGARVEAALLSGRAAAAGLRHAGLT